MRPLEKGDPWGQVGESRNRAGGSGMVDSFTVRLQLLDNKNLGNIDSRQTTDSLIIFWAINLGDTFDH